MSGMADEMARRMQEDGGAGLPGGAADLAPGSEGEPPATPPVPPAGESNTDTAGRTPDAVPYARFKEVNDRYQTLKDFEQLTELGYDPDSLGRLAAFEAQFLHDPVGTFAAMGRNLDLPQEVKDAIETHLVRGTSTPGRAEGEPPTQSPQTPELPEELKGVVDYVGQLRAREEQEAQERQLDATLSHWDELDKQDGITKPEDPEQLAAYEGMRLAAISATAGSGQVFTSTEQLVQAARKMVMGYRAAALGGAIRTGRSGAPPALPDGRPAPTEPVKFSNIREASKAAQAALERGELPPIISGA